MLQARKRPTEGLTEDHERERYIPLHGIPLRYGEDLVHGAIERHSTEVRHEVSRAFQHLLRSYDVKGVTSAFFGEGSDPFVEFFGMDIVHAVAIFDTLTG